jgi:hypothetical protein
MCTFLTVGVPPSRQAPLERALRAAGLHVERQPNPAVAALFPAGRSLLLVTHGGCSCDLVPPSVKEETPTLAKRGLTKGQLARALEQRRRNAPRERPERRALVAVLEQHRPAEVFFQAVSGDPRTEPVRAGEAAAF